MGPEQVLWATLHPCATRAMERLNRSMRLWPCATGKRANATSWGRAAKFRASTPAENLHALVRYARETPAVSKRVREMVTGLASRTEPIELFTERHRTMRPRDGPVGVIQS